MSVTIIVAIGFWLAGAYIEYRCRKASPFLDRLFQNFWVGLVMTGIIGYGVTLLTGPAVGVGAVLGQLIGLATNEFTFKFYDITLPKWIERKNTVAAVIDVQTTKIMNVKARYDAVEASHPQIVADVKQTAADGAKTLAAVGVGVLYVAGTPAKVGRGVSKAARFMSKKGRRVTTIVSTSATSTKGAITSGVGHLKKK